MRDIPRRWSKTDHRSRRPPDGSCLGICMPVEVFFDQENVRTIEEEQNIRAHRQQHRTLQVMPFS